METITFYSADRRVPIKNRRELRKLVRELFKKERTNLTRLSYIFCSDEYLSRINQLYLNHADYTDVISFCLSDPLTPVFAEIYLSTERIKENAKAYGETYQTELLRVMIHGALHLCGYKDKTAHQIGKMRLKENFYLQLYSKSFT